MISFPNPFKARRNSKAAHSLYSATILAARDPWLFNDCEIADTPEGRFEVLTLMAFLVLRQLKEIDGGDDIAQAYFDIMLEDIDSNLREMGVGESTLAKKMKKLAASFFGRIKTYDQSIAAGDFDTWEDTIRRYLYENSDMVGDSATSVAQFTLSISEHIAGQDSAALLSGHVSFDVEKPVIMRGQSNG